MKIELLKPHTMNSHRLNSNPKERRLLEAWAKEQERGIDRSLLSHLLSPPSTGLSTGHPSLSGHPEPSDRDYLVAGTVIQWLGSPVGQGFLRDLYEKKEFGHAMHCPTCGGPVTKSKVGDMHSKEPS